MIFDSHAHYEDEKFDSDRIELLSGMREKGIGTVVNVGSTIETSKKSIALAEQYEDVYAAIGVHPSEIGCLSEEGMEWLRERSAHPKVVAIGEIGLDYYWDKETEVREEQKKWFEWQMELARAVGLPIVIHSREAAKDTLDMVKSLHGGDIGGVMHCFSYPKEMAREYLNMGFYLGIGGVLTFQNARVLKEVAAYAPLEQIVLETDCPYLAPKPNRGKRNSSLNLPYVVKALAEIKNIPAETVMEKTWENGRRLYRMAD